MSTVAPSLPASPVPPPTVMAGALVHLADWLATRCPRAAQQAALCLARLSTEAAGDPQLLAACDTLLTHIDFPADA